MGAGREMLISLDNVRDKNMMQLKKINTVRFPISYNDKYYSDALTSGDFTKLGFVFLLSGFSLFFIFFIWVFWNG
uniref:Putative ovule protein n=1 Tax=Solanum chacoense TaxID=4108 RepID=A0A0V0H632_SOLCH